MTAFIYSQYYSICDEGIFIMAIGTSGEYYSHLIRPIVTRRVRDLEKPSSTHVQCACVLMHTFNVLQKGSLKPIVVGLINHFFLPIMYLYTFKGK